MAIYVGSVFQRDSATPHHDSQVGEAPASPEVLGPPTCAHTVRKNNQVLHGDQNRSEENFSIVDPRLLTRDILQSLTFL